MSMRILGVVSLTAVLAVAACASDRTPPRPGPAERAMRSPKTSIGLVFASYDSNQDGLLIQAELDAGIEKTFSATDTDRDGSISPLEFEAFSNARLGGNASPPYRLDFDRNVDGRIMHDEFFNELRAIARNLDEDKDGVLKPAELAKASGGSASAYPEDGPKKGERGPGGGGRGRGGPPPR